MGKQPPKLRVVPIDDPSGVLKRIVEQPNSIRPRYAPIADIARSGAAGYEVLLALDADRAVSPADWSRGFGAQGAGRLEAALVAAALAEREHLPAGTFLAVNVSGRALRGGELLAALRAAGRLDRIALLVKEDSDEDVAGLADALGAVRELGGLAGLDETGTGYASLRHVVDLKPDFVRLGPAFVAGLDGDQAKGAIVEAIQSVAVSTGARVIAAGIPGRPELSALRRMGVPLGMGPLFGPPAAAMGPLPPPAAEAIRQASPPVEAAETVAGLIEEREPLAWGSSLEQVADRFLEDPMSDVIVLVDEHARPLALAERAALMRGEPHARPIMRISPTSPQKAVARRAAARPWLERFHPLVACDRRGVYLGIVRIEQLLDALAQED